MIRAAASIGVRQTVGKGSSRNLSVRGARTMSGTVIFDDKGKGEEIDYINAKEKLVLAKLRESKKVAEVELENLLGEHKLPKEVINKLIDWKYHSR